MSVNRWDKNTSVNTYLGLLGHGQASKDLRDGLALRVAYTTELGSSKGWLVRFFHSPVAHLLQQHPRRWPR